MKKDQFPSPSVLQVDDNGKITFTMKQWKWLLKFSGSKAKSPSGQRKAVRKLIHEALTSAIQSK